GQQMRHVIIGFCLFATACVGTSPTAPTSSLSSIAGTSAPTDGRSVTAVLQARGGSELPFKGTYEGLETVVVAPTQHHLDATGNATHLGLFTVTANWTLAPTGNYGTSTWTAANGDELSTSFRRSGVASPPTITF